MGMFQKVNDWLADKGEKFARSGNRTAGNAYYASQEAEQAYGGMRNSGADTPTASDSRTAGNSTGRSVPVDRFSAENNDKYGGRVPYRSQKDIQAEADAQRQQMEEQARRQQGAAQQRTAQAFGQAPMGQPAAYPQQAQPNGNVIQFPGMIRGPEGNLYAHVEYVVLLRSRNECTKVIEYIKANASVFLNMEFIANDSERQRCVDMLSGAAYTLGCQLNKISQRGIYLISSPSVCVVIDPAMQKYATAPEAQGYVRQEYAGYGGYAAAQPSAYAAQSGAGYASTADTSGYAPAYGMGAATGAPRQSYAADSRQAAYAAQPAGGRTAYGARTAAYAGQTGAGYAAAGSGYDASAATQPMAAYAAPTAPSGGYAARTAARSGGAQTGAFAAQPGARTGEYPSMTDMGYGAGAATGSYVPQPGAGARVSATAARQGAEPGAGRQASYATPYASGTQQRRTTPTFGMQGAFSKSAEGGQPR